MGWPVQSPDGQGLLHFRVPTSLSEVGPDHVGILLGVLVFLCTVLAAGVILVRDGTLAAAAQQAEGYRREGPKALRAARRRRPELYDELLDAAARLPRRPALPPCEGDVVRVERLAAADAPSLYRACSGAAYRSQPAFEPLLEIFEHLREGPFDSEDALRGAECFRDAEDAAAYKITSLRDGQAVGAFRLCANRPRDLCVALEDLWLTPGARRQGCATEAVALTLQRLFEMGYRRVEFPVDAENRGARRFLERGVLAVLEGLLRKHRVVRRGNQDTALFAVTNSRWRDVAAPLVARRLAAKVNADAVLRKRRGAKARRAREDRLARGLGAGGANKKDM